MITYTYVAAGGLNLRKCGIGYFVNQLYLRNVAFTIGDQAWLKYRAEKGILESVTIKKIKITPYIYQGRGPSNIMYFDTFNAAYNETDLVYYDEAVLLVENFIRRRNLAIAAAECLKE
jgi:hypothetical protein